MNSEVMDEYDTICRNGRTTVDNWSVVCIGGKLKLARSQGDIVTITSGIESVDGRVVTTKSGSRYRLGCIDDEYLQWLRENGYPHDSDEPKSVIDYHRLLHQRRMS